MARRRLTLWWLIFLMILWGSSVALIQTIAPMFDRGLVLGAELTRPTEIPEWKFHGVVISSPYQAPTALPERSPRLPPQAGRASWYSSWCDCNAMRIWRGRTVLVEGPAGTARVVITDYGPSRRKHPDRVIDLNPTNFQRVCGDLKLGTCKVSVTLLK